MQDADTEIVFTRQELYNRVWATPMRTLAAEMGLSDVGLAKICKRLNIPRPNRGYWAKVENGKKVVQRPLIPTTDAAKQSVRLNQRQREVTPAAVQSLAANPAIEALIRTERDPANRIVSLTDLRGADPLVASTRDSLSHSTADEYGRVSRRYDFASPCFDVQVGKQNIHRSLLLLHTMVRSLRDRGFHFAVDDRRSKTPYVDILGERFTISVWEASRRQKRQLTRSEEAEKAKYAWMHRDYEHVPSGVLELHLNRDSYFSSVRIADTKKVKIEERLNEFVVGMFKEVDRKQVAAEQERIEAQAAKLKKDAAVEKEVLRRSDRVRAEKLLKVTTQWEHATRIKRCIEAVRNEALHRFGMVEAGSEIARWLEWSERYLDSIDPLSAHRDLPSFSLTPAEIEQLTKECESDWSAYSESFRSR